MSQNSKKLIGALVAVALAVAVYYGVLQLCSSDLMLRSAGLVRQTLYLA